MRTLVTLACCVALAGSAHGAQQDKSKQKKETHSAQHAAKPTTGHPASSGGANKRTPTATSGGQKRGSSRVPASQPQSANQKSKSETSKAAHERQKRPQTSNAYHAQNSKRNRAHVDGQKTKAPNERQPAKAANAGEVRGAGKRNQANTATGAGQNVGKGKFAPGKPVKPQHFNLAKQPNTAKAPAAKFQQGRHIQGSHNWHGQQYSVFRNYNSQWHDRNWWHNHYRHNIVFVFGAPYYWNAGYWFPAWGYYPNAYYAWDGPIYAYNRLPPDQVIANVQASLQQQGYYQGEVDGLIGPVTRGAIADYQRDHGLYITSAIDQPTLQSLGMT